jgi:hypothetical protein
MIVKNEMRKGLVLFVSFFVVFFVMWAPWFGKDDTGKGLNAFEAADNLFNSISKGSSYFLDDLREANAAYTGKTDLEMSVDIPGDSMLPLVRTVLDEHTRMVQVEGQTVYFQGNLVTLVDGIIADSSDLYHNRGTELVMRYGVDEAQVRAIGYAWYLFLKELEDEFNHQGDFHEAKYVKEVISRGVEVGYNFYGIEAEKATSKAGILTFSLVFYVVYTLWWGMAIFYLFEGFGLKMTKGKKKEV